MSKDTTADGVSDYESGRYMRFTKVITYTGVIEAIPWTDLNVIPPRIIELINKSNTLWGNGLSVYITTRSTGPHLQIAGNGVYDHYCIDFDLGDYLIVHGGIDSMDDIETASQTDIGRYRALWEEAGWTLTGTETCGTMNS